MDCAKRVDADVDRSLATQRDLAETIRSAFDLVSSRETARLLELAHVQQERSKALQHALELITAILLVPTLVAGIYGANTSLPGGGNWDGFAIMLVLMVAGALAALFILRRSAPGREPQVEDPTIERKGSEVSDHGA